MAPRVVLFAITNRCNRACDFCSRDRAAPSMWTVDSALQTLSDFSRAGVLEVTFGGGEPLAFRGFDELIERLGRDTPLALHLTTNGELLTPERAARLVPHLGEVRLSVFEGTGRIVPRPPARQRIPSNRQALRNPIDRTGAADGALYGAVYGAVYGAAKRLRR